MNNHSSLHNYQLVKTSIEKISLKKKTSIPDRGSNIKSVSAIRQQSAPTASSIKSVITYSIDDDNQSKITIRQCNSQYAHKQLFQDKSRVSSKSKISLKSLGQQSGCKTKRPSSISRVIPIIVKLNLHYSDIMLKNKKSYMFEFAKRFCSVRGNNYKQQQKNNLGGEGLLNIFDFRQQTKNFGCKCEVKCLVVQRWLRQHGYQKPKYQKILKKDYETHMIQIQKDLRRTQPFQSTFAQDQYLNILKQTLSTYVHIDPQLGYTQGMNFIASVFVYHSPDLISCIKLMNIFFYKKNYRSVYLNNFLECKRHARQIIKIINQKCADLYSFFFQQHQIELSIFIEGWLISLFANVIPLQYMHLAIDMFMNQSFRGVYKIIITLLMYIYEVKTIYMMTDEANIMELLSFQGLNNSGIDWQQILLSSNNFPLTINDLKRIQT